jgi:leucyl aminopeptidase (aminopeptidase T)
MISAKLKKAAKTAIEDYVMVDPREALLIVYDTTMQKLAFALRDAAKNNSDRVFMMEIPHIEINGDEPPNQLIDVMRAFDVVITVTTKGITHTGPRHQATKGGVRVASIPEMSEEAFCRNIDVQRSRIEDLNDAIWEAFQGATIVHVTTESGTDVTFEVTEREVIKSSGRLHYLGSWGTLPSGEVYVAPIEEETTGVIVADASIGEIGLATTPVEIEVMDGTIIDIRGRGATKTKFENLMHGTDVESRTVGAFGIGTNYNAQISGDIAEDEKVLGTCHFSFGNNFSFGGTLTPPSQISVVVIDPTIEIDGKILMRAGKFTFEEFHANEEEEV